MTGSFQRDEQETVHDFHHWLIVARELVHSSFTSDEKELQRLTMQAAQGLMLDHRLGAIETHLADIKATLNDKE